ncbi:MAG: hypothetical protein QXG69_00420 [Candidatus Caldarchaeum sp.]
MKTEYILPPPISCWRITSIATPIPEIRRQVTEFLKTLGFEEKDNCLRLRSIVVGFMETPTSLLVFLHRDYTVP